MKKVLISLLLIIFTSCAVIVAPPGGPKDTTPPTVLEYYPNNYATNFSDDYISIQFDKYMNKSSVLQSFSISPEIKFDYSWSGKKLTIEFEEEMQENTTYVAKLNTGYTDFKGNKPETALTFIFTKGDKVDKGKIVGKLLDPKPEGKQIFAWRDKDMGIDITQKPDYSVSLGSSGDFELIGLKKGLYRIIAIEDKFKDGVYNSGIDGFGAAQYDLEVLDSGLTQVKLKIAPPFDRVGPGITNAYPISNDLIQVNLTEPVFSDSLRIDNIQFENSSQNIKSIFTNDFPITKKIYLECDDIYDTTMKFKVKLNDLNDTLNNSQIDSLSAFEFGGLNKEYTKILELLTKKIDSKISTKYIDLVFNHPIKSVLDSALLILNKKDSTFLIPEYEFRNLSNKLYLDISKLKLENQYILKINPSKIIDFKSQSGIDSTFSYNFTYSEIEGKSKIKGKINDSTNCVGKILILLKNGNEIVSKTFLNGNEFEFKNLPEANYNIEIICDENENGQYDYGNDIPFNYSEIFYIYDRDLKIKENWDIDDVIITIK